MFRGLSLFSFEKNKTNLRQKKRGVLRAREQSRSFTISHQGDFLRHFPFACGCRGRSCDPDDKGSPAMRDGARRVTGQRLHSITRTSYQPRTFMLVCAEVVGALLPSPYGGSYTLVCSLRLFVWRDVALAPTFTSRSGRE